MGSLTRSSAANPFEVVCHFAERTGGEGHLLPVPFIADSISDKQIFMSQRVFKQTLALAEQASFCVSRSGNATNTACCFAIDCCRVLSCRISNGQGRFVIAWESSLMRTVKLYRAI